MGSWARVRGEAALAVAAQRCPRARSPAPPAEFVRAQLFAITLARTNPEHHTLATQGAKVARTRPHDVDALFEKKPKVLEEVPDGSAARAQPCSCGGRSRKDVPRSARTTRRSWNVCLRRRARDPVLGPEILHSPCELLLVLHHSRCRTMQQTDTRSVYTVWPPAGRS